MSAIDARVRNIARGVQDGLRPEQAAAELVLIGASTEDAQAALEAYLERVRILRLLKIPRGFSDPTGPEAWYLGPDDACDRFWPAYRDLLLVLPGYPRSAVDQLNAESTKIVSHLPAPFHDAFKGRGLVLGHVQSGKTSNFTAVMAKAADVRYRLFIVLSGVNNNLRRQTQQRLDQQLVAPLSALWFRATDEDRDFGNPGNVDYLLRSPESRVLVVVKKNKTRLMNLCRWLEGAAAATLRSCPTLVIDDEADQAGVNVGTDEDVSAINRLILRLLTLPKAAYVGYTATPYANFFINPAQQEGLYPRDFIVDLERPGSYFGPERIFGRDPMSHEEEEIDDGLDMIRLVPDEEADKLRPPRSKQDRQAFTPEVTPSLRAAILYFGLATAARRVRGETAAHSTMLIHTTLYTEIHELLRGPVRAIVRRVAKDLREGRSGILGELEQLWDRETFSVPAEELQEDAVAFGALLPELAEVFEAIEVKVDNSYSDDRLDYTSGPQTVIVIGGNTLSRGLTLEGLVVSFFLRTASAYDTLLQMGRWFGYRRGYSDLPRIWMSAELQEYFRELATVEREIRIDIARYEDENLTPLDFGVRIATHPTLAITSALKMQKARSASMSFSDRRIQTILFRHNDHAWLKCNLDASIELVREGVAAGGRPEKMGHGVTVVHDVPVSTIVRFFESYVVHEDAHEFRSDLIRGYVTAQNEDSQLLTWNIAVMGRGDPTLGTIDLGLPDAVGLIGRAQLSTSRPDRADIKSLMSRPDRVVDLGLSAEEIRDKDDEQLQALREQLPGVGLLLLYPINKDSEPAGVGRTSGRRKSLEAAEHVIGVGLVFPRARRDTPREYMSVDLSGIEREETEIDPKKADREHDFTGEETTGGS